mmetsp:Transcript_118301/g.314824  ORF Transcript_118301/g.314824 Transcript_118301/m.314824 type:complete len:357 (-) Transcript_118301:41-1111(-)
MPVGVVPLQYQGNASGLDRRGEVGEAADAGDKHVGERHAVQVSHEALPRHRLVLLRGAEEKGRGHAHAREALAEHNHVMVFLGGLRNDDDIRFACGDASDVLHLAAEEDRREQAQVCGGAKAPPGVVALPHCDDNVQLLRLALHNGGPALRLPPRRVRRAHQVELRPEPRPRGAPWWHGLALLHLVDSVGLSLALVLQIPKANPLVARHEVVGCHVTDRGGQVVAPKEVAHVAGVVQPRLPVLGVADKLPAVLNGDANVGPHLDDVAAQAVGRAAIHVPEVGPVRPHLRYWGRRLLRLLRPQGLAQAEQLQKHQQRERYPPRAAVRQRHTKRHLCGQSASCAAALRRQAPAGGGGE